MPIVDLLNGDPLAPFEDFPVENLSTQGAADGVGSNAVEALVSLWGAVPSLQLLASDGLLHYVEAPEGTRLPFVTIHRVSGPIEQLTQRDDSYVLVEVVQISVRAAGASKANAIVRAIRRAVRFATLEIDGRRTREVFVVGGASDKYDGRSEGAREVYFESVDLEVSYPSNES